MRNGNENDDIKEAKSEKRATKREKERYGRAGGSWAGQAKRARVNRNYEGLPPSLMQEVKVRIKKKRKK